MHTLETRKRRQFNLQELYQVNWFLGALLALLSILTVIYLDYSVFLHLIVACGLVGAAFLRPQITAIVPKLLWQAVPFLLVILLAIDLHLSRDLVPALIRLNVFLVLYRCLAFRRKREDLQLIILCLFLIIIVGVTTVTFVFPLQILLFTAVAMSFLFNITLMEDSRDTLAPREIWRDFTWRRFLRKVRSRCDMSFVVVAAIAFSSVVVLSILLFLAIPRFDINNPLPFLGMNRAARTGFSESIRFGDVTDIRNDDRVALRVEVSSEERIPADPYWRMLVLDEYVDGGFRLSLGLQHNSRTDRNVSRINYSDSLIQAEEAPDEENVWTLYLEGGVARYLPLTGTFRQIRFQDVRDVVYIPQTHVLGTPQVNSKMFVYQVENMEVDGKFRDPDFGNYTLEYDWYPDIGFTRDYGYSNYPDTTLALPPWPEDVEYLQELVEVIGEGEALTALEFAERATDYVQERHSYSMSYSVRGGDGDHVVRWLKSSQPGHCEVFAGALLLICRAAGIPTRVVTGFRGGSWNTYENYFMVRNSDAHAWVEIFDGRDSWIRVDPTPGAGDATAGPENEVQFSEVSPDSSLSAYIDSLRILWYRRIVSFDQSTQSEIWSAVEEAYGRIRLKERLEAVKQFFASWWRAPWNWSRVIELLGLSACIGLFALLVTFIFRHGPLAYWAGAGGDPVRRMAGRQLQRLRLLPPPQEMDEEQANLFRELVFALQRLRYGPPEGRGEWRIVIKRARQFVRAWR